MTDWLMSLYLVSNSWEDLRAQRDTIKTGDWGWHKVKTIRLAVINGLDRKWKYLIYNKFRDNYLQGMTAPAGPSWLRPYFSYLGRKWNCYVITSELEPCHYQMILPHKLSQIRPLVIGTHFSYLSLRNYFLKFLLLCRRHTNHAVTIWVKM